MKPRRAERRIGARSAHPYLEFTWAKSEGNWPRRRTIERRARVINLSLTGVLFETPADVMLKPGEPLDGYVGEHAANVEVIRFEPSPDGQRFRYGATFHTLSVELAEFIRRHDPRGEQRELLEAWLTGR